MDRFWEKVNKTDGCWLWIAGTTTNGYGNFSNGNNQLILAHRFSYILANGPIPDRLMVLHKCDTPACVRPDHLFLGTALDNVADMWAKGRAHPTPKKERPAPRLHIEAVRRGSDHFNAKLNEDKVRLIRIQYASGRTIYQLADQFGVAPQTIHRVVTHEMWKHVA